MSNLTLIEPAREGEPYTTPPSGLSTPQASSPPASDFERLFEFFKDKRPAAVPFALGQRVEVVARKEKCPTCSGDGSVVFGQAGPFRLPRSCPECGGSGWQEVR